jgi:hypothetical protein
MECLPFKTDSSLINLRLELKVKGNSEVREMFNVNIFFHGWNLILLRVEFHCVLRKHWIVLFLSRKMECKGEWNASKIVIQEFQSIWVFQS